MHRILAELLETKRYAGVADAVRDHVGEAFFQDPRPRTADDVNEHLEDVHVPRRNLITMENLIDHLRAIEWFEKARPILAQMAERNGEAKHNFRIPRDHKNQTYSAWVERMDRLRERYDREKNMHLMQLHQKLRAVQDSK